MCKVIISAGLILTFVAAIAAQIAQGGGFALEQSVVAGGGASANAPNNPAFSVSGAIGQPAGATSGGASFSFRSGFFTPEPFAPTAASVSVSGRILTPEGVGLRNAQVFLTDFQGNSRTALSGAFGYFNFPEVEAGQTYILTVVSKRYQFAPRALTVSEEITELNLVAQAY